MVAMGVPHMAAADVTIKGYTIPKGTIIFPNILNVLNNKNFWDDSDAFTPERFLSEDGKLIKREELIFFSTGKLSGWYSRKRTNFSPWFHLPTKYGMPSAHMNIFLNNLICP